MLGLYLRVLVGPSSEAFVEGPEGDRFHEPQQGGVPCRAGWERGGDNPESVSTNGGKEGGTP